MVWVKNIIQKSKSTEKCPKNGYDLHKDYEKWENSIKKLNLK